MEIKITCPYCEADNYVAEGRESVFCSACGEKIEIKYTGGVDVIHPWEKKLDDAFTYMELQEFEKAEQIITPLIKEDPGNFWLYRPYVEAITQGYKKLLSSNRRRVLDLVDKTIALAPAEYRTEAIAWKGRIIECYDIQAKSRESVEWAEKARGEKENIFVGVIFFAVALLLLAVSVFLYKDPAVVEITRPMFGAGVVICGGMLFVHIIKYKKALRRCMKLNAEVMEWNEKIEAQTDAD
jgi:tetratricopeptide (TPR) repeat protein